jgi:two-component sensor histidine kinase
MTQNSILTMLQALISGLDERLVIFDNKGDILFASYGVKELFQEEIGAGSTIFDYIDGDTNDIRVFLQSLSHLHFVDLQLSMIRTGKRFPVRLRMAAWSISEAEFVVIASLLDATTIARKKRDLLRKTLTIEQLSKSQKIRAGKLHDAIYEILEMSSKAVGSTRVNAWLFSDDNSRIECIGNFDSRVNDMVPQLDLPVFDKPNYFNQFETEKIILAPNAQQLAITSELNESYLIPNDIQSLMDIPLRLEGEIIGVICFEHVETQRVWSLNDQKFGLIASQMVSLAVETHKRKLIQQELEEALAQQKRITSETNHRIKNNLAITLSLLRLQLSKCQDDYHRNLIQNSVNRVHSIVSLHELLSDKNHFRSHVPFQKYATQLIQSIENSMQTESKHIELVHVIESCDVSSDLAITLGLIINESVTNAYKHAFLKTSLGKIDVRFRKDANAGYLEIRDNGSGLPLLGTSHDGEGLDILKGLAEHIDANLQIESKSGTRVALDFNLD